MSSNEALTSSEASEVSSFSLGLSQDTVNRLMGAVGLMNPLGDVLEEQYRVEEDEDEEERDEESSLPGSSTISISRAVFLANNQLSQVSSEGSSQLMIPSTPPPRPTSSPTHTPPSSSHSSSINYQLQINNGCLSPTLIDSPTQLQERVPVSTSPLSHLSFPLPPPLTHSSQQQLTLNSQIPQNVPLTGFYGFSLSLGPSLPPSSKTPTLVYSSQTQRLYIKKDATVPITFTTTRAPPESAVLNAMAIHKLPEMIGENLKCCVKHVDEMRQNGVLNPFHFVRSSIKGCCYYGNPDAQRLSISIPLSNLQKARGGTEYTALYQFPCFTSDFKKAGQQVQVIFSLECEGGVVGRTVVDVRVCASPGRDHSVEERKKKKAEGELGGGGEGGGSEAGKRRRGKKRAVSEVAQCTFPSKRTCFPPSERVRTTIETFPEIIPHLAACVRLLERVYMVPLGLPASRDIQPAQPPSLVHQDSFPSLEQWLVSLGLSQHLKVLRRQGVRDTFQALSLTDKELRSWGLSEGDRHTLLTGAAALQETTSLSANPPPPPPSSSQPLSQTSTVASTLPFASFEVLHIEARKNISPPP